MSPRSLLAVLPLAAALAAVPLSTRAAAPCRVVLGGGSRIASPTSAENDFWNRLNFAFYDAGQYALTENGDREAPGFFHLVGAPDGAKGMDEALAKAASAGCAEIVRLSVYGDDTGDPVEVVFRIVATKVERDGAAPRLGAEVYQREYRFAVTPDVEKKVVPSLVGERAVAAYLDAEAGQR